MWFNFILVLVTLYALNATIAADTRPKRDLVQLKNFITSLMGIGNQNLIQTKTILRENDEKSKIFVIPANEEFYVLPHPKMGKMLIRYPGNSLREIYRGENIGEEVIIPYPVVKENYMFERPIIPNVHRFNVGQHMKPPYYPCNARVSKICAVKETNIITKTNLLPPPPLYIQNRLRELLLHPIPPVSATNVREGITLPQSEIVMPPPELREVHVNKYNLQRFPTQEEEIVKAQHFTDIPSDPVHSRYMYKQIYHSDPSKNTAIVVDNTESLADVLKEKNIEDPVTPEYNRGDNSLSPRRSYSQAVRTRKIENRARIFKKIKPNSPYRENTRGDIPQTSGDYR